MLSGLQSREPRLGATRLRAPGHAAGGTLDAPGGVEPGQIAVAAEPSREFGQVETAGEAHRLRRDALKQDLGGGDLRAGGDRAPLGGLHQLAAPHGGVVAETAQRLEDAEREDRG